MIVGWLQKRWRELSPHHLFVISFLALILIATLGLLTLPGLYTGAPLRPLDALFTATSAVCVTGLVVVDTATHFTRWGQLWVLLFIQLGGLGLISLTTLIIGALGRRLSLRSEMLAAPVHQDTARDALAVTFTVARFTFAIEGITALLLWPSFAVRHGIVEGAWHAVFHAVSAFCNAGFSTFSDSLMSWADDPIVIGVVSLAVIVGGLGYLTAGELRRWVSTHEQHRHIRRLSTHTYAALWVTAVFLVAGTVAYAFFEWNGVLEPFNALNRLTNAFFMSTTSRTAGFNAVAYDRLNNESAYLTILLMVVGGSPGSTAGGIKTVTFAVLLAMALSRVRGRRYVELHGRTVPDGTVERAVSLTLVFFTVITAGVFLLTSLETGGGDVADERGEFLTLLFEAVSATATVGLSMGATAALGSASKVVLIVLMFVGRVGPLAFFAAISVRSRARPAGFRPAREDVVVG